MSEAKYTIQNIFKPILLYIPILSSFAFFIYQGYNNDQSKDHLRSIAVFIIFPFIITLIVLSVFYKYNKTFKKIFFAIIWMLPLIITYSYLGCWAMNDFPGANSLLGASFAIAIGMYGMLFFSYCIIGFFLATYLIGIFIRRRKTG